MKNTRPEQAVRTKNLLYSHLVRCRMRVGLKIFQRFSSSFFWSIYLEKSFKKNRFNCPNNCWNNNHFSFQNDRRCISNVFSSKIEFQYIVLTSCWNTLQKKKIMEIWSHLRRVYNEDAFYILLICKHFSIHRKNKKLKEQI